MRLPDRKGFVYFKCDGCGTVARFRSERDMERQRRKWKALPDGKHLCPKPSCAKQAITAYDLILALDEVYKAYRDDFYAVFFKQLKDYWDRIMGFDVVKFDVEVVQSGDGVAYGVILRKWGQPGVRLIKRILAAEKRAVEQAARLPDNTPIPAV